MHSFIHPLIIILYICHALIHPPINNNNVHWSCAHQGPECSHDRSVLTSTRYSFLHYLTCLVQPLILSGLPCPLFQSAPGGWRSQAAGQHAVRLQPQQRLLHPAHAAHQRRHLLDRVWRAAKPATAERQTLHEQPAVVIPCWDLQGLPPWEGHEYTLSMQGICVGCLCRGYV